MRTRIFTWLLVLVALTGWIQTAVADEPKAKPAWPMVQKVDAQPLVAQVQRLQAALESIGNPLDAATVKALEKLKDTDDAAKVAAEVQRLLDPQCVVAVDIDAKGNATVVAPAAKPQLMEQGWRTFLIKVCNHAGVTTSLRVDSPNAQPVPRGPKEEIATRFLDLSLFNGRPLLPNLSGLELEYRILQIYTRDAGEKTASLAFNVGQWKNPKRDDKAKPTIRDWRFDKDAAGWKAANQCEIAVEKGKLKITSTGNDPYITAPVEGEKGKMVLRFWAKFEKPGPGQVFWWTKERDKPDGKFAVNFPIQAGQEREYTVRFTCDGKLAGIRLDPGNDRGLTEISWISLEYEDDPGEQWLRIPLTFDCQRSTPVTFRVLDENGKPAMAAFEIRDDRGRVYPAQSKRVAPDFFFQAQIYRETGEEVRLPAGKYTIRCSRGPESIPEVKKLDVADKPVTFVYQVQRWVDPAKFSWWSGDHHIHAAGCAHYEQPTEGVHPPDMLRHIMGEDLKVGACLTWGPCFDYQKRFFTGKVDEVSKYPYLLRYDVEVSGFGSHVSGHLCLLRLKEQIYPGGESKQHWPTLGLNTLRWAKKQGAICGPAHSASGLTTTVDKIEGKEGPNGLPNFRIPAYDGIGANEYIVDITHEVPGPDGKLVPAIDFISTMDTDRRAEFNMWYHTLNCGFRVRASGETDFPCISGQRVGMGRVYVKVDGKLDYDRWCQGIGDGRSYVSDGTGHLIEFVAQPVDDAKKRVEVGVAGSELKLAKPATLRFVVQTAVRRDKGKLPVELIVNGYPVAQEEIVADGKLHEVKFEAKIEKSSWVAIRIFPSAHTNPIFVLVDGQPIRASKASGEWCLRGVDQCWSKKKGTYKGNEQKEAEEAYEHARKVYKQIIAESKE